jgi:MYXO-CTERM domain-containing protein
MKAALSGLGAVVVGAALLSPLAARADVFSTYESETEGFKGTSYGIDGVTYREVNNVTGFYPDGMPFNNTENGNDVIIERAVPFYADFPTYGSPVNSMTFGNTFVTGDNLSIGALSSVWMDLPSLSSAASFHIGFYENGPWGNIQWRLDAVKDGVVVASDSYTFSNLGGRDNPTWQELSVSGANFDKLHLYGWLNNNYTAPRGMIDNLSITAAVPEPASLGVLALAAIPAMRRRRRA